MKATVDKWLHGLIGGFIGGFASAMDSAIALIILDPKEFNLSAGLRKTLLTSLVLGVLAGAKVAFAYLKQSPLPPEDGDQSSNTMNKTVLSLLAIAAIGCSALLFNSGCVTQQRTDATTGQVTTYSTLDTNVVIEGINAVVPAAVRLACTKDSNSTAYFQQALVVIRAAISNGQFDPALIRVSLDNISIRELRYDNAVLAEESALALYQAFAGQVASTQVDKVTWLRPVLTAIANAIQAGLPATPTP